MNPITKEIARIKAMTEKATPTICSAHLTPSLDCVICNPFRQTVTCLVAAVEYLLRTVGYYTEEEKLEVLAILRGEKP